MNNEIAVCSTDKLSDADTQACLEVIKEGDSVNLKSATIELPLANLVVVVRDGQNIVGVGAIKQQRPDYASQIAEKSGFSFDKNIHELGYVAVTKSHQRRHLSDTITAKLLDTFHDRPLFATTYNPFMKRTLTKAHFLQRGSEWRARRGQQLSLWINDAISSE